MTSLNLWGPGRADLHLGRGLAPRSDTLKQTLWFILKKPLADGAGQTLFFDEAAILGERAAASALMDLAG